MTMEELVLAPHAKTIAQITAYMRKFNWPAGTFIVVTPLISLYAFATVPIKLYTCLVMAVFTILPLLCITTGYHRLWSHRTYEAHASVKLALAVIGSAAFSMSILDWANDHRQHHKYTDTDKDPYNAKRGLFWSHIGWLLTSRQRPRSDVRDLVADPIVVWQHKYYVILSFTLGWVVPTCLCGFGWGDWRGGFYYSIARTVVTHHIIFSINSLAHWTGDHIFTEQLSPRDNGLLAFFTFGEGYHNFHHEFPNDYRNGIHRSAYDPTKWIIYLFECVGLAWALKRTPDEAILKAKTQTMLEILQRKRAKMYWGKPIESLPLYTREEIAKINADKKVMLVIYGNIVYDITEFLPVHPGGDRILRPYLGKDISKEFNGAVYQHTNSAKFILDTLRCGVLAPKTDPSLAPPTALTSPTPLVSPAPPASITFSATI